MNAVSTDRLYLSRAAMRAANLPRHLRALPPEAGLEALRSPVVVLCASEILIRLRGDDQPAWPSSPETRYLVVVDVPEPAVGGVAAKLGVKRPDYRLHLTRDADAIRRLLVGLRRRQPVLGIVDAYLLGPDLHVLTADFEPRCFPLRRLPMLSGLAAQERAELILDEDGSYLHWPGKDLHVGVSQLLQAVDPAYMADIAIDRNERDKAGLALRQMREARGLKQSDIPGISARQVSRIEAGVSRLRYDAAQTFARAFGMEASELLDELGHRAPAIRTAARPRPVRTRRHHPT
jgi:hypothetical protein